MTQCDRREILRSAGLAAAAGLVATGTAGAQGTTTDAMARASDPESSVGIDWEADHGGRFAVADGRVALVTDDGRVGVYDAADGSREWLVEVSTEDGESTADAVGTPAIGPDGVYVATEGDTTALSALEVESGDVRWREADVGHETNWGPIVDGDLTFVVADRTLYAVDVADGEIEWTFDPEPMTVDEGGERGDPLQRKPAAVGDGAVFVLSNNRLFARERESGAERWTARVEDWSSSTFSGYPIVSDGEVGVVNADDVTIYDTATGDVVETLSPHALGAIGPDRVYAPETVETDDGDERAVLAGFDRESDDDWEAEDDATAIEAVAVDEASVYAAFEDEDTTGITAFDRDDGARQWHLETDALVDQLAAEEGAVYASADALFAVGAGEDATGDETDDGAAENGADDATTDGDADGVPGFAVGTGLAGGAVALEALRRRVAVNRTE